jgi:tetratricopeptide (TPR) repeat protein
MITLGQLNHAENLDNVLLEQTKAQNGKAHIYHYLEMVKNDQGKYVEAAQCYEKVLEIDKKNLSANILIGLLLTTTSLICITTWKKTRNHLNIMNVPWIYFNFHYHLIILISKL